MNIQTKEIIANCINFLQIKSTLDLAKILNENHSELIHIINYSKYKEFSIAKKNGGYRVIENPEKKLKIIQKKINGYLQAVYTVYKPTCSYGFISKQNSIYQQRLGIKENALQHVNKNQVLNLDIETFFPNIKGKQVLNIFLNPPFNFDTRLATALGLLCIYKAHLPSGAPSSPIISNFVCMNLDKELMYYCKLKKITYTRYADDLSFSTKKYFNSRTIKDLKQIVTQNGFKLNAKKTKLFKKNEQQKVTGLIVNKKINLDRNYIKEIKVLMHNCIIYNKKNAGEEKVNHPTLPSSFTNKKIINLINGKLAFIKMIKGAEDSFFKKNFTIFNTQIKNNAN